MPSNSKKELPLNPDEHGLKKAKGQFFVCQAEDKKLKLDVRFEELERRIQDIYIEFFKSVQNKIYWVSIGQTAAKIIHFRAETDKPNLGLTNYRGAKVCKQDVKIAKNYLNKDELVMLNNLVEQYLIFTQWQDIHRIPIHMSDWIKTTEIFSRTPVESPLRRQNNWRKVVNITNFIPIVSLRQKKSLATLTKWLSKLNRRKRKGQSHEQYPFAA